MERTVATALTSKIEATWSTGKAWSQARCEEWIEVLEQLDEGTAGTAFARLRGSSPECPSIARFIAEYRSVHGPDVSRPARHDEERISLDEYLARLARRSAQGNTDAGEELDRWGRWLAPKPRTIAARRERLGLDTEAAL